MDYVLIENKNITINTVEKAVKLIKQDNFGLLTFRVPVNYAGVEVTTVNVEIRRGLKNNKPSKDTKDLSTKIGITLPRGETKGLRNAKKALKDIEKATEIKFYEVKIVD